MPDQITFNCKKCGSKLLHLPPNPKPNDMVTCAGCGTRSRYAEVQAAAIKAGKEATAKALRDAFRKTRF